MSSHIVFRYCYLKLRRGQFHSFVRVRVWVLVLVLWVDSILVFHLNARWVDTILVILSYTR